MSHLRLIDYWQLIQNYPTPPISTWLPWFLLAVFIICGCLFFLIYKRKRDRDCHDLSVILDRQKSMANKLTRLYDPIDFTLSLPGSLLPKLSMIKELTGGHRIQAYLLDMGQDFLTTISDEEDLRALGGFRKIPITIGRLPELFQNPQPIIIEDLRNPHPDDVVPSEAIEDGNSSVVIVPIKIECEVFGHLSIFFNQPVTWEKEEISFYTSIGDLIGMQIGHWQESNNLKKLAVLQERKRLSQDLHDSFSQLTSALSMRAEAARLSCDEGDYARAHRDLERIINDTHEIQSILRNEMMELRNQVGDFSDLLPPIHECVERFSSLSNIHLSLDMNNITGPLNVPGRVGAQYLNILQEGLSNVRRHSGASQVIVRVFRNYHLLGLEIQDNGKGCDPLQTPHDRIGLQVMQERALDVGGRIFFSSMQDDGFKIHLELPL